MNTPEQLLITRDVDFIRSRCPAKLLKELEARYHVIYLPLMNFSYPRIDYRKVFSAMGKVHSRIWILLSSANSLPALEGIDRCRCSFAAIGTATAEMLNEEGYEVSFVPSSANAETFAEEFYDQILRNEPDVPVVLLQGSSSGSFLKEYLSTRHSTLQVVESYAVEKKILTSSEVAELRSFLLASHQRFTRLGIPGKVILLSGLQGKYFIDESARIMRGETGGKDTEYVTGSLVAYCIGQKTADSLREYGFNRTRVSPVQELSSILGEVLGDTGV
jgi:uroporphyrinogen-III synthase